MATLIIGQGAIGRATARHAQNLGQTVITISRQGSLPAEGTENFHVAAWDWESVSSAIERLLDTPDRLIMTSGFLWDEHQSPEKRLEDLRPDALLNSFSANALVPMAVLSAMSRRLRRKDTLKALVLTAKVGSIADNRMGGWYAYRASKAAANMLIRSTAIEWQRRFPFCSLGAYHPGTTDSELSAPFQKRVPAQQLKTPETAAECLWSVLEQQLGPDTTGQFWNWDGTPLPW